MRGGWEATGDGSTVGSLAGEGLRIKSRFGGPETGKQLQRMTDRTVSLFTEGLGVEDSCDAVHLYMANQVAWALNPMWLREGLWRRRPA